MATVSPLVAVAARCRLAGCAPCVPCASATWLHAPASLPGSLDMHVRSLHIAAASVRGWCTSHHSFRTSFALPLSPLVLSSGLRAGVDVITLQSHHRAPLRRAWQARGFSSRGGSAGRNDGAPASPTSMREKGDQLEARVAANLRRWGCRADIGVHVTDSNGNRSELDVVAWQPGWLWGWRRSWVVECKHYAPDHTVPLEAVAKFKEVLIVNRIPLARGVFVTTSSFTPRALHCGIATVDGTQLARWLTAQVQRQRSRWWIRLLLRSSLFIYTCLLAGGAAMELGLLEMPSVNTGTHGDALSGALVHVALWANHTWAFTQQLVRWAQRQMSS